MYVAYHWTSKLSSLDFIKDKYVVTTVNNILVLTGLAVSRDFLIYDTQAYRLITKLDSLHETFFFVGYITHRV